MIKYFKTAFLNRWNLLALFAGAGVALISGQADIVAALVLAGEVTYLAMLGTHPKFQRYVEAHQHKALRAEAAESNEKVLQRILMSLPAEAKDRYKQLLYRCHELRQIAVSLHGAENERFSSSLDSLQLAGLDRLLWIFLRLLFTQQALAQFLEKTDAQSIHVEIDRIEKRLAALETDEPSEHAAKLQRTLNDNLVTCRQRLANYDKAQANHEFVALEIDRLENKIKSLAELAVNRREHDFITTQVDEVANSMVETEKTMSELDFATGIGHYEDQVPQLLRQTVRAVE